MAIEVIITKDQLRQAKACRAYLSSPEWQNDQLVYSDWEATVERLLSTRKGIVYLDFLVVKGLVPMTRDELRARRPAGLFAIPEKTELEEAGA